MRQVTGAVSNNTNMYLATHSYYSLHWGTQSIPELVAEAQLRGLRYLGLADINTSAGLFEFIQECQQNKIKPIVGIDFRQDGQALYIGIAQNHEGLHYLNQFLTEHNLQNKPLPKRAPALPDTIFIYPFAKNIDPKKLESNEYIAISPKQIAVANLKFGASDRWIIHQAVTLAQAQDYLLHSYLVAIDKNVLISQLQKEWLCASDHHWLSIEQEIQLRHQYPDLFFQTDRLAESCEFSFDFGQRLNKKVYGVSEAEDQKMLRHEALQGLESRYGSNNKVAKERLERELQVIFNLGFTAYYLITWDMIRYSMSKGYYHVGRGSGANSIVAYCLRITDVDPVELDLYFERFLNPKRSSPPDFDIDYSWTDREDIQNYLIKRHGKNHTCLLGATITFQGRSILRELGKVRGLPKAEIDRIIQEPQHPLVQRNAILADMVVIGNRIKSFPSGRSIHAGGIIISDKPITWYTALILPPKGLPTAELDMYESERIGLDKFDILSQRGIGHINQAVHLIEKHHNIKVDIHDIPKLKQDSEVVERLYNGDTMGCFYVESPAMRQLLQKLHCREYTTLVAASSIIRPGVATSGMMKEYVERYNKPDSFTYLHPVMEEHLGETFGVMVYQEDVLKVCHHYAGMDLGDADILRRAMSGKNRSTNAFAKIESQFFDGAAALGRPLEITKEIWRQVSSFGGYSFCKAHSASYAVESFQSMYLKNYYPLEFYVAVVNNFGGFYQTWVYVNEAVKAGGKLCTIDINYSDITTGIQNRADGTREIYPGFIHIQGLEKKWIELLLAERAKSGYFESLEDFLSRIPIPFHQLRLLIKVGAFDYTKKTRKTLLMEARLWLHQPIKTEKIELPILLRKPDIPDLADYPLECAFDEYEFLGFPVTLNWFQLLKTKWRPAVTASNLKDHVGKYVKTLGKLVATKPLNTRRGERMMFGTFLDHENEFLDTVHFPPNLRKWPISGGGFYLIYGKVVEDFGVYCIDVEKCALLPMKAVIDGV